MMHKIEFVTMNYGICYIQNLPVIPRADDIVEIENLNNREYKVICVRFILKTNGDYQVRVYLRPYNRNNEI